MELQDQLETVRNHRGTVRVTIGNHTVNADIIGTKWNEATDENLAFLGANILLHTSQYELIRMQESVIDTLHDCGTAHAYILTQSRSIWAIAETLDLTQTAQGDFLWNLGVKYFP
jgi:hypothetical protein|uniref:Uncharacterized protein n=1 Tax=Myoviridae sp. ctshb19 TaxID=2825194 RepID=A0A8S5UGV0_9CAUD|nr:MAG TPA: hypothetical protein [Myoviridae sp. ctshb19]